MNKGTAIHSYNTASRISAVLLIVTLLWLTISTPFVYTSLQEDQQTEWNSDADAAEDESNPLGNTQEEKASSSGSLAEEFLHDHHYHGFLTIGELLLHPNVHADTYVAYHGELLVPPPNAA